MAMRVRFWGVRGSVPTPGPSTVRYGGNTVCVEVRLADGTCVVLDAGTGLRELGKQLAVENYRDRIHMFITHGHWDHILGLPFFGPVYSKDTSIVVHPTTQRGITGMRTPIMFDTAHFPVAFADLPAKIELFEDLGAHKIGGACVRHIELNHPGGATGFRIDDVDGTSMVYLTDNELSPPTTPRSTIDELAKFAEGASLLVHDAQYLPADMPAKHGWGHSVVDEVLDLARRASVETIALHHHDPDRDDAALDVIAERAAAWVKAEAPGMVSVVAAEGLTLELHRRG
jgi:phosphoribosyl 1,2-cyclic phosphodiesterase